jgi:hypothetical protein
MASRNDLPTSDPLREAETLVAIAEELERLTAEAWERARAATERAGGPPPLLARMRDRGAD